MLAPGGGEELSDPENGGQSPRLTITGPSEAKIKEIRATISPDLVDQLQQEFNLLWEFRESFSNDSEPLQAAHVQAHPMKLLPELSLFE
jgi:hypothetical protein